MTKAELESKHLAELHTLAEDAGVPRYRMLGRAELIDALAGGNGESKQASRPPRRARARAAAPPRDAGSTREPRNAPRESREAPREPRDAPRKPKAAAAGAEESPAPRRRRRRRRRPFARKGGKQVSVHDLLLPPAAGRQVLVHGNTRQDCATLLRELAGELAGASKGPDPVAVLIDPTPEEVADWVREAPKAEIVTAGQPRHAEDAMAQAAERAKNGEDIFLLVDSLTRLAEQADADAAKDFFDAGREAGASGSGTLTVVAAVERRGRD